MGPRGEECRECLAYYEIEGSEEEYGEVMGECRRKPPSEGSGEYPIVKPGDWCLVGFMRRGQTGVLHHACPGCTAAQAFVWELDVLLTDALGECEGEGERKAVEGVREGVKRLREKTVYARLGDKS